MLRKKLTRSEKESTKRAEGPFGFSWCCPMGQTNMAIEEMTPYEAETPNVPNFHRPIQVTNNSHAIFFDVLNRTNLSWWQRAFYVVAGQQERLTPTNVMCQGGMAVPCIPWESETDPMV